MTYTKRILIAIDQLAGVIFLGTLPDETISAASHRRGWTKMEKFINWLFRDPLHCAKAYISEMEGTQNAPEYQKGGE